MNFKFKFDLIYEHACALYQSMKGAVQSLSGAFTGYILILYDIIGRKSVVISCQKIIITHVSQIYADLQTTIAPDQMATMETSMNVIKSNSLLDL